MGVLPIDPLNRPSISQPSIAIEGYATAKIQTSSYDVEIAEDPDLTMGLDQNGGNVTQLDRKALSEFGQGVFDEINDENPGSGDPTTRGLAEAPANQEFMSRSQFGFKF